MTVVASDLALARARDEHAFARIVGSHRAGLHAHCYRMLGSTADADDAMQDALLRAWQALPRFEGRSSLRTWLYKIATNVCLKLIERRPRRALPPALGVPADPTAALRAPMAELAWLEPYPDELVAGGAASPEARYELRESVELAFVAALQYLPARQRAVLLLRDVLGFSPAEIATALNASPAAVYSTLQRAHRTVDERLPERSQQATLRAVGDRHVHEVARRYTAAWEAADVGAIVALLTEDATFAMPPRREWYRGPASIAEFLAEHPLAVGRAWRLLPAKASGQVAFGTYLREDSDRFALHAIEVLNLSADGRITAITAFHGRIAGFGLPVAMD